MRKSGIFFLFALLFSMMMFNIDAADGAGADGGEVGDGGVANDAGEQSTANEDIGDFDININDEPPPQDPDILTVPKNEWEKTQEVISEYQREKAFNDTVSAIKSEIPDFDAKQVVSKLKEIHEKDPQKAQMYNSEVGFKLLWREMTDNAAKNDPINNGSSKSGGNDFQSYKENAMQGKRGALGKALKFAL